MAGFKDAKIQLKKALEDVIDRQFLQDIGDFAADMIRLRTQLGYGVASPGGTKQKLKELSDPYKARRKKANLNSNTSASKSNLTFTGQLLSSQSTTQIKGKTVYVGPSGTRKDGKENADIGRYVSDQGRPYNNLSSVELKRITDEARKKLQAILEKSLSKIK